MLKRNSQWCRWKQEDTTVRPSKHCQGTEKACDVFQDSSGIVFSRSFLLDIYSRLKVEGHKWVFKDYHKNICTVEKNETLGEREQRPCLSVSVYPQPFPAYSKCLVSPCWLIQVHFKVTLLKSYYCVPCLHHFLDNSQSYPSQYISLNFEHGPLQAIAITFLGAHYS